MLNNLKVKNYKNLNQELKFTNNITLITAENGAGKSNLLESIYYISNGFDFGKTDDKNSINKDSELKQFNIYAEYTLQNKNHSKISKSIIFEYNDRSNKKLILNEKRKKSNEFGEDTKAIIFSPESIDLITGTPEGRRKELDNLLKLSSKEYYRLTIEYENVLKNRNKHLKFLSKDFTITNNVTSDKIYNFWTNRLIEISEKIVLERISTIDQLCIYCNELSKIYHFNKNKFEIKYITKSIDLERRDNYKECLTKTIRENYFKEIVNGTTMYGPHRDDIEVYLNDKLTRDYGSRAQQRIASFVIKLSEIKFLNSINKGNNYDNILLLDDIPSELDRVHIKNIEEQLSKLELQIIMTATSSSFFSAEFIKNTNLINLP